MKITKFDVKDHLDNEEVIIEYLADALEDVNPKVKVKITKKHIDNTDNVDNTDNADNSLQ